MEFHWLRAAQEKDSIQSSFCCSRRGDPFWCYESPWLAFNCIGLHSDLRRCEIILASRLWHRKEGGKYYRVFISCSSWPTIKSVLTIIYRRVPLVVSESNEAILPLFSPSWPVIPTENWKKKKYSAGSLSCFQTFGLGKRFDGKRCFSVVGLPTHTHREIRRMPSRETYFHGSEEL